MSSKAIVKLFALLLLSSSCAYQNQYLKSYTVGKKYRVKKKENMVEFRYARVREMQSGIPHVIQLKEQRRIVFDAAKKNKIRLKYVSEFEKGKYAGKEKGYVFNLASDKKTVNVQGFRLKLLSISEKGLVYQIVSEPEYLRDDAGSFFSSSSASAPTDSMGGKKQKGLAF